MIDGSPIAKALHAPGEDVLTLRYGSHQAQYGGLIVLPATPLPIGRVAVLALAGLFSLSACSVFAGADLAPPIRPLQLRDFLTFLDHRRNIGDCKYFCVTAG